MRLTRTHTHMWLRYSAATAGVVILLVLALTHARTSYVKTQPDAPANLLSNAHWSARTVTYDGGAVHMLTAPLPDVPTRRLLVRSSLWAIPATNVPATHTEMIVLGLQGRTASSAHASSMRLTCDHVKSGRAFAGWLQLTPGCTNYVVYIVHALPNAAIVGNVGLYMPPTPRQLVYRCVHAARWYLLVLAFMCILMGCATLGALRAVLRHVQAMLSRVPWLEPAGWWLLATLWLVVLCTVFFYYYHPHHIFVNSDDGWNILEIAYHRWHRDGLVKWSTDRAGALFIVIPQLLLETAGLKRWLPHAYVDVCFAAICLFVGTAWLGRSVRAFLINGPLLLAFCLDWNGQARAGVTTVSFWMPKIGSVPVLLVMLAFVSIITYADKRRWSFVAWACVWIAATASMVQSPGNAVVLAVWGLTLCAYDWRRTRTACVRLFLLAAALAGAYATNVWLHMLYDHTVHIHRQVTEMRFNWSAYLSHL